MIPTQRLGLTLSALALLSGCASPPGCSDGSCPRVDSDSRSLVIWWAPNMRSGLGTVDQPMDHSRVLMDE